MSQHCIPRRFLMLSALHRFILLRQNISFRHDRLFCISQTTSVSSLLINSSHKNSDLNLPPPFPSRSDSMFPSLGAKFSDSQLCSLSYIFFFKNWSVSKNPAVVICCVFYFDIKTTLQWPIFN